RPAWLGQLRDAVLVESPAGEDFDPVQTGGIEPGPRLPGQSAQVPRVEADSLDPEGIAELAGEADNPAHALKGIVGIHQQRRLGIESGEAAEGLRFVGVGLDVTVCHGPGDGYAVDPTR